MQSASQVFAYFCDCLIFNAIVCYYLIFALWSLVPASLVPRPLAPGPLFLVCVLLSNCTWYVVSRIHIRLELVRRICTICRINLSSYADWELASTKWMLQFMSLLTNPTCKCDLLIVFICCNLRFMVHSTSSLRLLVQLCA